MADAPVPVDGIEANDNLSSPYRPICVIDTGEIMGAEGALVSS